MHLNNMKANTVFEGEPLVVLFSLVLMSSYTVSFFSHSQKFKAQAMSSKVTSAAEEQVGHAV